MTDVPEWSYPKPDRAPIGSHEQLAAALKAELEYCPCAYTDAVPLLRDVLRLVALRTDRTGDAEAFRQVSRELEDLLLANGSGGMASWFVYSLERAGLLFHGFNVFDVWIQEKGRWLLAGLERFADPPPEPEVSGDSTDDEDASDDEA